MPAMRQGRSEDEPVHCNERRAFGRIRTTDLTSNLGPVLEISRTGMRVQSKHEVSGLIVLHLFGETGTLSIRGLVVHCHRHNRKQYEIGLQFHGVSELDMQKIAAIAMTHGFLRIT